MVNKVKISKENVAYGLSLAALCFSFSKWSDACCFVQIMFIGATVISGALVFINIINKGDKDA